MKRNIVVLAAVGAFTAAAVVGTALAADGRDGAPAARATSASAAPPSASGEGVSSTAPTDPATTGAPAGVSRARAVELARASVGGGSVVKVERETEHGRAVWSVRLVMDGARYRVDVDRATGRITRTEQSRASDDRGRSRGGDDHGDDDRRGGDDGGRHDGLDDHGDDDRRGGDDGGRHDGLDDHGGDGRGGDDDGADDHGGDRLG
jgi:hypothetical protein